MLRYFYDNTNNTINILIFIFSPKDCLGKRMFYQLRQGEKFFWHHYNVTNIINQILRIHKLILS